MDSSKRADKWDSLVTLFAGANVTDGILSAEIDSYRFKLDESECFEEITDLLLDIIVLSGELRVVVDHKEWICTPDNNNFVSIKPMNRLQNIKISTNFKGYAVALSRSFIIKHRFNYQLPLDSVMAMRFYPVYTFEQSVINNLLSIGSRIERTFTREVFCKRDLILIATAEFQMEKLIVVLGRVNIDNISSKKSRKIQIGMKFCDLVLGNCKKEHEVSFYAEKLCITPQYLSRILQEFYARSAKEIIDNAIISEAVVMLHSEMTIQQIADKLHFADQSSFGKFFKKFTGTTPTTFRESESEAS